jgi:DNA-nicking Smr family endonuclease
VKNKKTSQTLHSFEDLKDRIKIKPRTPPEPPSPLPPVGLKKESPEPEESLFAKAMEGVKPLSRDNHVQTVIQVKPPEEIRGDEDTETLLKLAELVRYGKGFHVSDTPEYIEGTGYHVPPAVAKRLHRGDFSIEAHVDLHGHDAEAAKEKFEAFMKWALVTNKKGVLVVHGRGLCSPSEPVLKKKVEEWLTRGSWRKWVLAYSSARACDGGTGATYVLLRGRRVSKRFKLGKWKEERKQRA